METEKTANSQGHLNKEEQSQSKVILTDFKLQQKAIVIKTVWYWHRNRYIVQQSLIKNPEIKPCLYGQLINDKRAKNIQWENFLSMSVAKLVSYMRENENGPFSYTILKK